MKHLTAVALLSALLFGGAFAVQGAAAPEGEILTVTSDYRPEMFHFDFQLPRLKEPEIVNAADFGLSAQSTPEKNAEAIEKISRHLNGKSNWKLILPGGEISVKPVFDKKLLEFRKSDDFIVEGNSTRFLFDEIDPAGKNGTPASSGYVTVEGCKRAILRNFTVGRDIRIAPMAFFGMVTEYDADTRTGKLQILSDESVAPQHVPHLGQLFNTTAERSRDLQRAVPAYGDHGFVKKWEMLSPKMLQFTMSYPQSTSYPGKYAMVSANPLAQYNGFVVGENDHLMLDGISVLCAPYTAFLPRGLNRHLIVRNCTVAPASANSYWAAQDGCDLSAQYYLFENNHIRRTFDDAMSADAGNVGAFTAGGVIRVSDHELIADKLQRFASFHWFVPGREIFLGSKNFHEKANLGKIVSVKWVNYYPGRPASWRCHITFEQKLPENIQYDDVLWLRFFEKGVAIYRNNLIEDCPRHGLWGGHGPALIENNVIRGSGYPAIMFQVCCRWGRWYKGLHMENIVIRNNRIYDASSLLRQPASVFIGGGYDTQTDGYSPADHNALVKNVVIENNIIDGNGQAGLGIWCASDVVIRNNIIRNTFQYPLVKGNVGNASIFVRNSKNVLLENNILMQDKAPAEPAYSCENSENVQKRNNTGF